jgi:hypothetical protein
MRKANLERLLARRPEGIFINPFERGEIGPDLFAPACRVRLEGLVSKRRNRPYQAGRSKHWVKMKNRKHPAMSRVKGAFGRFQGLRALSRGALHLSVDGSAGLHCTDYVPVPEVTDDAPVPALMVLLGVGKQEHENQGPTTHPATTFFSMAATPWWSTATTRALRRKTIDLSQCPPLSGTRSSDAARTNRQTGSTMVLTLTQPIQVMTAI